MNHGRQEMAVSQRRRKVAELRGAGASQRSIAAALNTSQSTVFRDLREITGLDRERSIAAIAELRHRELESLETMEQSAVERFTLAETDTRRLAWFDARLRLQQRRAALAGLDAARSLAVVAHVDNGPPEMRSDDRTLVRAAYLRLIESGLDTVTARHSLLALGMESSDVDSIYEELNLSQDPQRLLGDGTEIEIEAES